VRASEVVAIVIEERSSTSYSERKGYNEESFWLVLVLVLAGGAKIDVEVGSRLALEPEVEKLLAVVDEKVYLLRDSVVVIGGPQG
jgi:hypothetical protein